MQNETTEDTEEHRGFWWVSSVILCVLCGSAAEKNGDSLNCPCFRSVIRGSLTHHQIRRAYFAAEKEKLAQFRLSPISPISIAKRTEIGPSFFERDGLSGRPPIRETIAALAAEAIAAESLSLVVSQRHHGIDLGGAPRRHVAGEQRYRNQSRRMGQKNVKNGDSLNCPCFRSVIRGSLTHHQIRRTYFAAEKEKLAQFRLPPIPPNTLPRFLSLLCWFPKGTVIRSSAL